MRCATTVAIVALLLSAVALPVHAATIIVTNTNDKGPGSLRQALAVAHDGDRITFAVSGTITLTSGGLVVAKNVTISGPGADQLSVDGNQALLVFGVFPENTAAISGLDIRNAQVGVWNEQGTITVSNCVLSGNSFAGLYNHAGYDYGGASMTVANSLINNNSGMGAMNVFPPSKAGNSVDQPSIGIPCACMTITDSVVGNNSGDGIYSTATYAYSNGAAGLTVVNTRVSDNALRGISNDGTECSASATIVSTTVSGNSGGGVFSSGFFGSAPVTITNSTISGNSTGTAGGGIYNQNCSLHVANSTITGNSAPSGGGIYNQQGQSFISNTILNAGALGENIFNDAGTVSSLRYNLSSDDGGGYLTGPGDQINTDPLLGPLQDNGGPTLTHLPLTGSPAIDAGDPEFTLPPYHDQRGACFDRVFGRRIDIGSVETQPRRRCVTPAPRPTPH